MLDFTSISFLAFLLVTASLFRLCPVRLRPLYLLVISYAFYLTYNPSAALLLAAATGVTWAAGLLLERKDRTGILLGASAMVLLIGVIAFYKVGALTSGIVAPLGVSYYTFKLISYLAEIYLDRATAQRNLVLFASFAAFFPFMVAGPIQRPADFLEQNPPASQYIAEGIFRIAAGLFKKLVIADGLGLAIQSLHPNEPVNAWVTLCVFPMQLYSDFSGLTDIALGSGMLFGIRGPENFNRPFSATNIGDFWRRWHMSLTTWLTDYVFTPLRMETRSLGQFGLILSITINMVLIGIWHGISWTFLVFGLLNSLFLIVDSLSSQARRKFFKRNPAWNTPANWGGWILTVFLFAVALVFFHARSVQQGVSVLQRLGADLSRLPSAVVNLLENRMIVTALASYLVMDLAGRLDFGSWLLKPALPRRASLALYSAVAVMLVVGLLLLSARSTGPHNAFLYQQF